MASLKTFYRGKEPNRPVAQFFDRMPWYFSVGFRWSVGRLKVRSDGRRSVALPPGKGPNCPVATLFRPMPRSFSIGFRWSVGRLKGRSEECWSVALPPVYSSPVRDRCFIECACACLTFKR